MNDRDDAKPASGDKGAKRKSRRVVDAVDEAETVATEQEPENATDDAAEDAPKRPARPMGYDGDLMNDEWALVLMGSKAVVLHERPDAPVEDRIRVLGIEAFRAWFLNKRTEIKTAQGYKIISWATRWLASVDRRQYQGLEFAPGEGPLTAGYYNLWRGFSVEPKKDAGTYNTFKDHLLNNLCGSDPELYDWLFAWFAHIFQRPRERIGTALVLRGPMGSGKTKVGEVIGSLIAAHYFMVDDPRYVTGQFNAHMASCLLLQAEEAVWAGDKAAEGRLKGLVTSKFQMIEQKGVDPIRLDNHVRLIMTSNEDWVVPAGKDERRFCVLDVAGTVAQDHGYFAEMDRELAAGGREALLADLLAFDLSKVNLRQIPKTTALLEQKVRSLDSVEAWWFTRLRAGTSTRSRETWEQVISRAAMVNDYIETSERAGVKRRAYETEVGIKLHKIMPQMRTRRIDLGGDGHRIWCYELPTLEVARACFESTLGQEVEWPPEDAAAAAPAAVQDLEGGT